MLGMSMGDAKPISATPMSASLRGPANSIGGERASRMPIRIASALNTDVQIIRCGASRETAKTRTDDEPGPDRNDVPASLLPIGQPAPEQQREQQIELLLEGDSP